MIAGKLHYLEAALKGMQPFSKSSTEGGVRAYFMNQYPWYEEYPSKLKIILMVLHLT